MASKEEYNIEFEQYYLNNGLRVILHEDHRVPITAVNVWYHVGSKNERPGKTGFAHLFEHMMFQGSAHIPADMHFKLIQSVGGTLNGSTSFDRTNYFETLPSHYVEMGLWLESDRMGFLLPALDQQKLDNQLEVVKNERRQRMDNQPYGLWLEKLLGLSFAADFPYHWPVIGYMEDLEQIHLQDVRDFFNTYYVPNNASLVVAGDFDRPRIKDLIEQYFGELPRGRAVPPVKAQFKDFHQGYREEIVYDHVQLPRIYMAYHLPAFGSKQTYVADLLSDVLSEGKSARLYRSLIYEQKLAQDVQSIVLPLQLTSLLVFMITPKPGVSVETIREALQKEIDILRSGLLAEKELQRVKNQLEARKIHELQTVASRADQLNMFAVLFNDARLINTEIERYRGITPEDMRALAEAYLVDDNMARIIFLPDSERK